MNMSHIFIGSIHVLIESIIRSLLQSSNPKFLHIWQAHPKNNIPVYSYLWIPAEDGIDLGWNACQSTNLSIIHLAYNLTLENLRPPSLMTLQLNSAWNYVLPFNYCGSPPSWKPGHARPLLSSVRQFSLSRNPSGT